MRCSAQLPPCFILPWLLTVLYIGQVTWSPVKLLTLSESPVQLKRHPSPTIELNQNVYLFVVTSLDNYVTPSWLNIGLSDLQGPGWIDAVTLLFLIQARGFISALNHLFLTFTKWALSMSSDCYGIRTVFSVCKSASIPGYMFLLFRNSPLSLLCKTNIRNSEFFENIPREVVKTWFFKTVFTS